LRRTLAHQYSIIGKEQSQRLPIIIFQAVTRAKTSNVTPLVQKHVFAPTWTMQTPRVFQNALDSLTPESMISDSTSQNGINSIGEFPIRSEGILILLIACPSLELVVPTNTNITKYTHTVSGCFRRALL